MSIYRLRRCHCCIQSSKSDRSVLKTILSVTLSPVNASKARSLSSIGAKPHERTRRDHSSETAEDYVEAVASILDSKQECRVVDLAAYFGVSHVTVTRIVQRLTGEGLLETEPYRPIRLTTKGKRLAIASHKRHQIVHDFLLAIGVDAATAAQDAEGIEHHVSPTTLRRFKETIIRLSKLR